MEQREQILTSNSKEFYQSGIDSLSKKRFNAATDSFFKAVVTLCDFLIYRKIRLLPKDHTDRFDLLKLNFPEIFRDVSELFKKYRRTYNMKADENDAKITKEKYEEIIRNFKLEKEMQ